MDSDDIPRWRRRGDSTQAAQPTDCRVRWADALQATQDLGTTAETRCELVGRLLARIQHANG